MLQPLIDEIRQEQEQNSQPVAYAIGYTPHMVQVSMTLQSCINTLNEPQFTVAQVSLILGPAIQF